MLFEGNTEIPVNTTAIDPYSYFIPVSRGIVKRIAVFFPWGCAGLVGVKVFRYTWDLFPQSRGKWLIGNDITFSDEPNENIDTEPYELLVKAYNLDDTFPHTPIITVEMVKSRENELITQFLRSLGLQ